MTLSQTLLDHIHDKIEHPAIMRENFRGSQPIFGGDINEACLLNYGEKKFFVKTNSARKYPQMFEMEAKGLEILAQKTNFEIPTVLAAGEYDDIGYLLLEYIKQGDKKSNFWYSFGEALAGMHGESAKHFGLDHHNYIGKLHQSNNYQNSWPEFFAKERVEPQFEMAFNNGYFQSADSKLVERFLAQTEKLIPAEKPALVHGDLWNGNFLNSPTGHPVLIDPAIYYGHREMDIAMMHLFGGFTDELFQKYQELMPLEQGWKERLEFHNIYPILVHANLFGGGYPDRARRIMKRYAG